MFRASKRSSSRDVREDNPFENIFPPRREEKINIYSPRPSRVTNGERTKKVLEKKDHSPKSFNKGPSIVNNTQEEKPRRNNNYQSAIAQINGRLTTAADFSFQSISSDGQTKPYTSQKQEKDTINGDKMEAGQDHFSKSTNSGPSTISNAQKENTKSKNNRPLAIDSIQRPKQSLSSAFRDTPAWAKLMTARFDNHFKLLENQFAQMQIQIDTLTSNVKDLRSAFHDQQGIPPTDDDQI